MNAKIFLIPAVISIMGITNLSAQIETYEKPKEKPVEHEWDKYAPYLKNTKDAIETNKWWQKYKKQLQPYDSSFAEFPTLILADDYKNYWGQRLYSLSDEPREMAWYRELLNLNAVKKGKYYDFVDAVFLPNIITTLHRKHAFKPDSIWVNALGVPFVIKDTDLPKVTQIESTYFGHSNSSSQEIVLVLREKESGDTVYAGHLCEFLLVGGFEKVKQEYVDKELVYVTRTDTVFDFDSEKYETYAYSKTAKCINVALNDNRVCLVYAYPDNTTETIPLKEVLRNNEDIENERIVTHMRDNHDFWGSPGGWATKQVFDKINARHNQFFTEKQNQYLAQKQKELAEQEEATKLAQQREAERKQFNQEYNAKLAAQDAAYKQECIRTFGQRYGTLVYQGKVEIGMTMAMCEKVYKSYSVQAKEETQTASGMRTTIIYKSGRTHIKLVFLNNKLTSKATY